MSKISIALLLLSMIILAGCSDENQYQALPISNSVVPIERQTVPEVSPTKFDSVIPKETSKYTCNCSRTCPSMTCAEAQYQLNHCGCSRRDADGDGVACDAQCQ